MVKAVSQRSEKGMKRIKKPRGTGRVRARKSGRARNRRGLEPILLKKKRAKAPIATKPRKRGRLGKRVKGKVRGNQVE